MLRLRCPSKTLLCCRFEGPIEDWAGAPGGDGASDPVDDPDPNPAPAPRRDRAGAAAREHFSSDAASGVSAGGWYTGGGGGGGDLDGWYTGGGARGAGDLDLDPDLDFGKPQGLRNPAQGPAAKFGDPDALGARGARGRGGPRGAAGAGAADTRSPVGTPGSKPALQPDWSVYSASGDDEPVRGEGRPRRRGAGAGAAAGSTGLGRDALDLPPNQQGQSWVEGPIGGARLLGPTPRPCCLHGCRYCGTAREFPGSTPWPVPG